MRRFDSGFFLREVSHKDIHCIYSLFSLLYYLPAPLKQERSAKTVSEGNVFCGALHIGLGLKGP
jgi:hypothetical protein